MQERSFWGVAVLGVVAGLIAGFLLAAKRHMSPAKRAKAEMGRTARRAARSVRGSWRDLAGRFAR